MRLALPPPSSRAATSASASPGEKNGEVIHAMYTRGSSTWSLSVTRFSSVIGGVCTLTGSTSGPLAMVPKYFSISALVLSMSMSPATHSVALLGA